MRINFNGWILDQLHWARGASAPQHHLLSPFFFFLDSVDILRVFPQSSSLVAIARTVFVFCRVWIQRFLSWWLTALASTLGLELGALEKKE